VLETVLQVIQFANQPVVSFVNETVKVWGKWGIYGALLVHLKLLLWACEEKKGLLIVSRTGGKCKGQGARGKGQGARLEWQVTSDKWQVATCYLPPAICHLRPATCPRPLAHQNWPFIKRIALVVAT